MIIRLKKGSRVSASAEDVFTEVENAKVDGNVELPILIERARPKGSPLHREFTWDNGVAADQWRLHEARKVVQSVEVIYDDAQPTRAWQSVTVTTTDDNGKPAARKVFRSIGEILDDPMQRSELLARAISDATLWRRKYADLQELTQIHAAIDDAMLKKIA